MKNKNSKNTTKNKTNKVADMKSSVKHTEKPAVAFNGVHKLPYGEQESRGRPLNRSLSLSYSVTYGHPTRNGGNE